MYIRISSADWEEIVGDQVRRLRFRVPLTQCELASAANISVGAVKNLENGRGANLITLIKVLRVLEREDWLDMIAPQIISPVQLLRDQKLGSERKRASRRRDADV